MKIYIDSDYKCYVEASEGLTEVETDFFNGKCKTLVEGYRFIPPKCEWKRKDGVVFKGEMIAPWKDYSVLEAAQQGYEESLAEMQALQEYHSAITEAIE